MKKKSFFLIGGFFIIKNGKRAVGSGSLRALPVSIDRCLSCKIFILEMIRKCVLFTLKKVWEITKSSRHFLMGKVLGTTKQWRMTNDPQMQKIECSLFTSKYALSFIARKKKNFAYFRVTKMTFWIRQFSRPNSLTTSKNQNYRTNTVYFVLGHFLKGQKDDVECIFNITHTDSFFFMSCHQCTTHPLVNPFRTGLAYIHGKKITLRIGLAYIHNWKFSQDWCDI